jgi:LPS export ABC transporter protein LptC
MFKLITYKKYLAAVICCLFLFACENKEAEIADLVKKNTNNEEATNIVLQYTTGGKPKAILTAPLMLRVQDSITFYEFPKTVHGVFFNEQQQEETIVDALYGKYSDGNNTVYLKDSVKIVNLLKGDTIYCEDLYWNGARKGTEFYTYKKVRIKQIGGQYINGANGLEADEAFKNFHIRTGDGKINGGNTVLP